jgi:WD40 repeat protein
MAPGGGVALELRQRVTGGATGAVALLPRAAGDAVDVAYPSGEVVVVSEVSASGALSDAPVVLRPGAEDGETTASGSGRIVCAWAPGEERRGLLAVGAQGAVHLYAPSHASGDAKVGDAWMRVDRIALDADATALTWTDDGEAIAVATSSGFVGAFEWRVAKWEPPTTGEEASPSSDNAEWRRRGRAPVAQALIAAGTSTAAAIITAGTGSRRAFLWRGGGDAQYEGRETLTHPAPVVDASIVNSQSTRPGPAQLCALTVAADGAVRLWTTAHRGSIGGGHHEGDTMRQALVIQTHGPDLFAAKWLSVSGGEYVVGVSRDGYVRAWRVVGAEGSSLGRGLTIPRAHLWTTVRISSGGYERVNAGNASWTCEPVGVSGRTARIRFASVEAGTSFRDVRLDEPRFPKDDDADADDDDADASASASFIGHGARVTRVICSVCAQSGDSTAVTADDAGGALAWRVTAAGTLTPAGNARDEIRTAAVHTYEPTDTHVGIHEGVPSDAVAVAPAPFGEVLAVAFASGKVAVYEAESTYPRGTFTLESEIEIISHGDGKSSSSVSEPVMLRWFDAGAGCLLLATCAGPAVSVYARVPGSNDFGVHSSRSSVVSPWTMLRHRLFHANVSACAWTARGESLVVGVGREVLALGSGAGLAMALATEAAPAREYHPSVLLDWLARGEVGRARLAARYALAHLRAIGDGEAGEGSRGGLAPVPIAELVAEGDRVESKAEANVPIDFDSSSEAAQSSEHDVPEFDANAFGGFAGFAPAPSKPKPLFAFGQDLPAADDDKTAGAERTAPGRRVRAPVRHERFSAAEAEEGAELVAAHGDVLVGLGSDGRMALLGALDALVDADGGTDSYGQIDEAGRRFRMLSRERKLRSHRDEGRLDAHGPRGVELAWALQCDTQDALLSSVLNDESKDKSWKDLRRLGAPLWLRDTGELRRLVDAAARAEFAATRDPGGENPCALLYAALGRTSVLAGLFKASRETRLAEFLSRNFAEDRHREAALKNAYALMSKHRYSFAAAFFVLAGQHADAAALVWRRLGDLSLAVTVARFAPADANASNPSVDTGAPFTRVGSARNDAGIVGRRRRERRRHDIDGRLRGLWRDGRRILHRERIRGSGERRSSRGGSEDR